MNNEPFYSAQRAHLARLMCKCLENMAESKSITNISFRADLTEVKNEIEKILKEFDEWQLRQGRKYY